MLKINDLLDRTSKIVSSAAAISLGLAVITFAAVAIKENTGKLLSSKKVRAHVICVKSSDEPSIEPVEKETQKTTPKKGSSKKNTSKPVVTEVESSEPAPEAK